MGGPGKDNGSDWVEFVEIAQGNCQRVRDRGGSDESSGDGSIICGADINRGLRGQRKMMLERKGKYEGEDRRERRGVRKKRR